MDTQRCVGGGVARMEQLVCANNDGETGICGGKQEVSLDHCGVCTCLQVGI